MRKKYVPKDILFISIDKPEITCYINNTETENKQEEKMKCQKCDKTMREADSKTFEVKRTTAHPLLHSDSFDYKTMERHVESALKYHLCAECFESAQTLKSLECPRCGQIMSVERIPVGGFHKSSLDNDSLRFGSRYTDDSKFIVKVYAFCENFKCEGNEYDKYEISPGTEVIRHFYSIANGNIFPEGLIK